MRAGVVGARAAVATACRGLSSLPAAAAGARPPATATAAARSVGAVRRLVLSRGGAGVGRTLYIWGRPAAVASASLIGARRGLSAESGGGDGASDSESSSEAADKHPHFKLVLPDMGQSKRAGTVTAWRKAEGDFVKNGDVVCEVEMDEFTVGMEIDDKGFLARILVPAGTKDVPVGEPLAVLVYDEKDVEAFNHLAPYRPAGAGAGEGGEDGVVEGPADGTALLKFIHKLVRSGQLKDKEFAKRLQALARQEDKELLRVFEASFEGPEGTRREADFDAEFFFENSRGILEERDKGGKPVVMAAAAAAKE